MTITACTSALVIGYDEHQLLEPLDLQIREGVTALFGRNGSGKTTLMRTICGIIPALAGSCTVLGEPVKDGAPVRSRVGYLGHESALATKLTVQQNLAFWQRIAQSYPDVTLVSLDELIERFDLSSLLTQPVKSLSRGQRQRVDLARVAMTNPQFIVLDEPLTGLDPVYAAQTRELLRSWGTHGTVLYSTHSVPEALQLATRYLVVSGSTLVEVELDDASITEHAILKALEEHA